MARSHNLKAQETEGPQKRCSVVAILVKTDEHVVGLQLHFSEFEQKSKPIFAALGQSSRRDFHVEVPSLQRCPPHAVLALRTFRLKQQEAHSAVSRSGLFKN